VPFDWKRIEVWVGILIGLPGFLILFLNGQYAIAFVILCAIALLIYSAYLFSLPEFTITEIEKILIIRDKQGSVAVLIRRQKAICNHKGVTEFWCGGIGATGGIDDIRIDKRKPDAIEESCKQFRICKHFTEPLRRGERFSTEVSYKVRDSFLEETERLIHSTDYMTKELIMRVRLPPGRKCKAAKAYTCINQHPQRHLAAPDVSSDQREITLKVVRPKKGVEYVVEWVW
jgi:hypothetical protein